MGRGPRAAHQWFSRGRMLVTVTGHRSSTMASKCCDPRLEATRHRGLERILEVVAGLFLLQYELWQSTLCAAKDAEPNVMQSWLLLLYGASLLTRSVSV